MKAMILNLQKLMVHLVLMKVKKDLLSLGKKLKKEKRRKKSNIMQKNKDDTYCLYTHDYVHFKICFGLFILLIQMLLLAITQE